METNIAPSMKDGTHRDLSTDQVEGIHLHELELIEAEMAELAVSIRELTGDTRAKELPGKLAKVRALADERRVLAQGPVVTPIGPRETVDRIDVTNEVFLKAVFGGEYARAHCAAFKEDPHELEKLGLRWKWGGGAYPEVHFEKGQNQYFTVSLFHREPGDKSRRRKNQFEGLYALMLDDIGNGPSAKVSPDVLKGILRPSYALMTSPENHQCGLLLEWPETERGRAEALINGMVKHGLATDGKDPGQAGVTRYAKLPESYNTKSYYTDESTPEGFKAKMIRWSPDLIYTPDEIAACLGLVLPRPGSDEAKGIQKTSGGSLVERYGHLGLTAEDEPLLLVLQELGMVSGRTTGDDGWLITCPKIHEHTQRADSGTALMDDGRLVCHHGHAMGYALAWQALREDEDRSEEEKALIARHYAMVVALEFAEGELVTLAEAVDTPFESWKPEVMDALAAIRGRGVAAEFRDTVEAAVPEAERLDFEMELDDLVARVSETREKAKEEAKREELNEWESRVSKFNPLTAGDFAKDFAAGGYFIKDLLPKGEMGMIWGAPGAGKSFVALDMCFAIAEGKPWRGYRVRQANVIYVCAEGARGFKKRVMAVALDRGIPPGEASEWLTQTGLKVIDARPDLYSSTADAKALVEAVKRAGVCDLLVVDTLAQTVAGADENGSEMAEPLKRAQDIGEALGCMVVFIHHSGKDESKGPRGWSGLKGPLDAGFSISRPSATDAKLRRITAVKIKDGEDGMTFDFALKPVKVGVDEDGDDIVSCVVDHMMGNTPAPVTAVEDFKADERQDRLDLARKAIVCIRRALSTSGVDVATLKPGLPGDVLASIPAGTLAVSTDQWVSDLQNRTEVLTPSEKKKLMGILKSTGVVFKHGSGKTPSRTWVDTTGVMATSEGRRWWREAGEELGVKDPVEPGEDSQF